MRYDAALSIRLAMGALLLVGVVAEVKIRAALHTGELLVVACRNHGLVPCYREEPRHRTRTL